MGWRVFTPGQFGLPGKDNFEFFPKDNPHPSSYIDINGFAIWPPFGYQHEEIVYLCFGRWKPMRIHLLYVEWHMVRNRD